jgi:hypothetical protein
VLLGRQGCREFSTCDSCVSAIEDPADVAFVFIQSHIDLGVCGMRLATANQRVQNSFGNCLSGFDFFGGFLSWYYFPCICNSLELEPAILQNICYILAL